MNPNMLAALADQRSAELRAAAAAMRRPAATQRPDRPLERRQSLRVRTGWTLVDLGLRMVAQPGRGLMGRPRPAGS
jgi:hypothetical protein